MMQYMMQRTAGHVKPHYAWCGNHVLSWCDMTGCQLCPTNSFILLYCRCADVRFSDIKWNKMNAARIIILFHVSKHWRQLNVQLIYDSVVYCAFSALTLLVGRHEGHPACKKLSGGVLAWLSVWSEAQTCIRPSWCHCHSLSLALVKSRLVLPFWYRLTRVFLDKGPLNGCVCVRCVDVITVEMEYVNDAVCVCMLYAVLGWWADVVGLAADTGVFCVSAH